jgi:hypothetical protein
MTFPSYRSTAGGIRAGAAALAALAFIYVCSLPASAQNAGEKAGIMPPGGPAPRTADGHPDLTGTYWPNRTGSPHVENTGRPFDPAALRQFDARVTPEAPPVFLPAAEARMKAASATQRELSKLSVNCIPRGLPAIWLSNTYATQLIQTPGMLVQLIEVLNNFRIIHTDGRPHPKYPEPLYHGNPSAKWEGDTLVIESIGFDPSTFVSNNGSWFHSDEMRVTERLSRPSKNYLQVQITVDDPKVLARPWTSAPRNWTLINEDVHEYYCTNNPDVDEFQKLDSQGK